MTAIFRAYQDGSFSEYGKLHLHSARLAVSSTNLQERLMFRN